MDFVTAREFCAAHRDSLPWLVDPFAVEGSAIFLYGRQGVGKSSLAWQLAHALTTGETWLHHTVHKRGKVLYLNLDMPALEFQRLIQRAEAAGMVPNDDILVAAKEDSGFDILEASSDFIASCQREELVGLVVDTANDAYLAGRIKDINAEVRAVIARFRKAVPHGVLVLLSHDRKRPAYQPASAGLADLDAFLGASAWEAKATTSLRITGRADGTARLHINKCRIDKPPYDRIEMDITEHGFFVAKPTVLQALYDWTGTADALKDVFEAIARTFKQDPETVRRAYNRAVRNGVRFRWTEDVSKHSHRRTHPNPVSLMSDGKPLADKELGVGQGAPDSHIYIDMVGLQHLSVSADQ